MHRRSFLQLVCIAAVAVSTRLVCQEPPVIVRWVWVQVADPGAFIDYSAKEPMNLQNLQIMELVPV